MTPVLTYLSTQKFSIFNKTHAKFTKESTFSHLLVAASANGCSTRSTKGNARYESFTPVTPHVPTHVLSVRTDTRKPTRSHAERGQGKFSLLQARIRHFRPTF